MTGISAADLDAGQYAANSIEKYEAIYGCNFISPGGKETAQEFLALMALQPGMKVLDVGCGLGGSAFLMAEQYGVSVRGIDRSTNMLQIARARCQAAGLTDRVVFEHGDILDFNCASTYDRVYSRDVFLHIQDKVRLMRVLKNCLAPGGVLLFTDYCCSAGSHSQEFEAYIHQRNYFLYTVNEYRALLAQAGFTEIMAQDRTPQFIDVLERELARLPADRFSPSTLADIMQAWQDKIARARRGEQRWGLCMARRPMP